MREFKSRNQKAENIFFIALSHKKIALTSVGAFFCLREHLICALGYEHDERCSN